MNAHVPLMLCNTLVTISNTGRFNTTINCHKYEIQTVDDHSLSKANILYM